MKHAIAVDTPATYQATLDMMAMAALPALVEFDLGPGCAITGSRPDIAAELAYRFADAMMAERAKRNPVAVPRTPTTWTRLATPFGERISTASKMLADQWKKQGYLVAEHYPDE
jgi:hypothetical protein